MMGAGGGLILSGYDLCDSVDFFGEWKNGYR